MVVAASSIRLVQRAEGFRLETASQRLRLKDRTTGTQFFVSLVSTVHLADQQYFAGIQRECESFDRVLFELIADESLTQEVNGVRRLREPLRASEQQRQMARSLSLSPQIDVLDCTRSNWALADVPRAEVLQREISLGGSGPLASFRSALRTLGRGPASRANNALRPLSWVLPAPELALLLDDWTSSGGAPPAKVLQAIAGAAVSLDIDAARRLSFAQTLATGEATQRGSPAAALVSWRNERALQTVEEAVGSGDCRELALVYGALHMRDMRVQLQQRFTLLEVEEPSWRTAWTVPTPRAAAWATPASAVLLLFLLLVDGNDWLETTSDLLKAVLAGTSVTESAAIAVLSATFYAARHSVLYLALSRWAFEWDRRWYNEAQ